MKAFIDHSIKRDATYFHLSAPLLGKTLVVSWNLIPSPARGPRCLNIRYGSPIYATVQDGQFTPSKWDGLNLLWSGKTKLPFSIVKSSKL